jgi:DNA helicase II / ATP-dependent DNA helicase PcrA
MAHNYLTDLNQEQRCAVKHGVKDGSALNSRPLLGIAGAGSGKTKTLAHRVAHLVVNGIDAQRILLLTFTRRAALDMTGRVKRITGAAIGIAEIDLPWAGTFHDRRSNSARICQPDWPQTFLYNPRSVRCRRSDGCGAA